MKVTKNLLEYRFNQYNRLYFDSRLYYCKMQVIHSTNTVGWYVSEGKKKDGLLCGTIYIARNVDWTEELLKEIIIHEMIHHYVAQIDGHPHCDGFSWYGIFGHGTHYRAQVKRLKREFGLNIRIHGGPFYLQGYQPPTTLWGKLLEYISCRLT